MIDKLYLQSTRCVILYFVSRPPMSIVSDQDNALELALIVANLIDAQNKFARIVSETNVVCNLASGAEAPADDTFVLAAS